MKKSTKSIVMRPPPLDPAQDLTGKRFGKWVVLGFEGKKVSWSAGTHFSKLLWLCRCECGVEKLVTDSNLLRRLSTQCQRCAWNRHGTDRSRLYLVWQKLKRNEALPKAWQDYEAFRKAVGDPPDDTARLRKYVPTKPHGPGNTFWMTNESVPLVRQMRKKLKEESILRNRVLMKIRTAETKDQKKRYMISARKAGYSYQMIGIAAGLTRQAVQQFIARSRK